MYFYWYSRMLTILLLFFCLAAESAETEPEIEAGMSVTVIVDNVPLGTRGRTVAKLAKGTKFKVTEVRGRWVGGYAIVDGERKSGWLLSEQVKVKSNIGSVNTETRPDKRGHEEAIAALKEIDGVLVVLDEQDQNIKGIVVSDVKKTPFPASGFEDLARTRKIPLLVYLLENVDEAKVNGLSSLRNVETLRLALMGQSIEDSDLAMLASLKNVTELHLAMTKTTDEGLKHIAPLTQLRRLDFSPLMKSLDMSSVTARETDDFHKMGLVAWAVLGHGKVTDSGLAHLSNLIELRELNLACTGVGDEGLKQLKNMKNLERLSLFDTAITNDGLDHIAQLKSLKRLNISWCHGINGGERIKQLATELPECKIDSRHSGN